LERCYGARYAPHDRKDGSVIECGPAINYRIIKSLWKPWSLTTSGTVTLAHWLSIVAVQFFEKITIGSELQQSRAALVKLSFSHNRWIAACQAV
jgi:hypothetical protein